MPTETIEVPKKRKELLLELEVGGCFPIENTKRASWAGFISDIHSVSDRRWSISKIDNETKIWRLK